MRIYTSSLFCIGICAFLLSCGDKETENHKFPDMPFFPEHTNPEIEIVSLGYKIGDLYKNTEDTFITMGKNYDDVYRKFYVFEMDYNMVRLDSVNARGVFEILEDGSFYTNGNGKGMLKYQTIKSTPTEVGLHPFNARKYRDEAERAIYIESFDKNGFPDISIYKSEHRVDSLSFIRTSYEFNKLVLKGLKCVVNIGGSYGSLVLIYEDKEYIGNDYLNTYPYDYGLGEEVPHKLLSKVDRCELKFMKSLYMDYNTEITLVHDYVTGYGSTGANHFSLGTPYEKGLQYFNLEINGVTTSFKIYAPRLSTLNISSRHIPDTDVYIIDIVNGDDRYPGEMHSYVARIKK